jgi:hypothetical protein
MSIQFQGERGHHFFLKFSQLLKARGERQYGCGLLYLCCFKLASDAAEMWFNQSALCCCKKAFASLRTSGYFFYEVRFQASVDLILRGYAQFRPTLGLRKKNSIRRIFVFATHRLRSLYYTVKHISSEAFSQTETLSHFHCHRDD